MPEMLNLLGCSKENFIKLVQKMNYKIIKKEEGNFYFKYLPNRQKNKKTIKKTTHSSNNPFDILKKINFK